MTELSDSDLRELVEAVWTVTLGFDVLDPAGSIPPPAEQTVCGCVQVTGAWTGMVTVRVSDGLARNVAATMFDTAPETLSEEELHDALGEIANMTGGTVKALLPGPSRLSLPTVVSGGQFSFNSPGGKLLREVAFRIKASRVCVQVIEAREPRTEALSA
jgi:chemotaxis protein CheX